MVLSTAPDETIADRLARALVEEGLAACVTRQSGWRSVYRWEGEVATADEVQLIIKTSRDRLPALNARLEELHPYDVPEVIALEAVGGSEAYLRWMTEVAPPEA